MSRRQADAGSRTRQTTRFYSIRVRGPIGPTMLQAFPTLTARSRGRDTVLSGSLVDMPALYGALHQLESFGLDLLELRSWSRAAASQPNSEERAHTER